MAKSPFTKILIYFTPQLVQDVQEVQAQLADEMGSPVGFNAAVRFVLSVGIKDIKEKRGS